MAAAEQTAQLMSCLPLAMKVMAQNLSSRAQACPSSALNKEFDKSLIYTPGSTSFSGANVRLRVKIH